MLSHHPINSYKDLSSTLTTKYHAKNTEFFKDMTYIETLHPVEASSAAGKPAPTAFPTSAALLQTDTAARAVTAAADTGMCDV